MKEKTLDKWPSHYRLCVSFCEMFLKQGVRRKRLITDDVCTFPWRQASRHVQLVEDGFVLRLWLHGGRHCHGSSWRFTFLQNVGRRRRTVIRFLSPLPETLILDVVWNDPSLSDSATRTDAWNW